MASHLGQVVQPKLPHFSSPAWCSSRCRTGAAVGPQGRVSRQMFGQTNGQRRLPGPVDQAGIMIVGMDQWAPVQLDEHPFCLDMALQHHLAPIDQRRDDLIASAGSARSAAGTSFSLTSRSKSAIGALRCCRRRLGPVPPLEQKDRHPALASVGSIRSSSLNRIVLRGRCPSRLDGAPRQPLTACLRQRPSCAQRDVAAGQPSRWATWQTLASRRSPKHSGQCAPKRQAPSARAGTGVGIEWMSDSRCPVLIAHFSVGDSCAATRLYLPW